ncbi:transporter [Pseudotenacibaculum haliotis]|uniref:Transporter n=1 Tax=Pseudotenacibaculum haliotis TaxID=1862138 RepID=A0ABW5LS00_9FLAO
MKSIKIILTEVVCIATTLLNAQEKETENTWKGSRPDGHAPISVMGDHYHGKGELMFSYRYMYMNMEGLKAGSNNIDAQDVLIPNGGSYMVSPTQMPMNMHMLGAMYAPSDKLTLMSMFNYISMDMDHITAAGGAFATESSGLGDIKISALYKFLNKNKQSLHGQLGFSLPTGSIDNKSVTPASNGNEVILPYPMQIGSGTFDTDVAVTYLGQAELVSWGSQLKGTFRFGENDNGYRLGNQFGLNNWFAVKAANWISFSARVQGLIVNEIEGLNPALNPNMVITANTVNSGGEYIFGGLGFNFYVPEGNLKNFRFGFEFSSPLYQNLNGVQLKQKETITLGVQYAL